MSSVNRVTLLGNVGSDPEVRNMSNGEKVVSFRLATSETWKANGERKERTTWHQIVVFNQHIAGVVESYVQKGSKIYLEGSLQTRDYEKDGVKRYVTEVVLTKFKGELQLLDKREPSDAQEPRGGGGGAREDFSSDGFGDGSEIPFAHPWSIR